MAACHGKLRRMHQMRQTLARHHHVTHAGHEGRTPRRAETQPLLSHAAAAAPAAPEPPEPPEPPPGYPQVVHVGATLAAVPAPPPGDGDGSGDEGAPRARGISLNPAQALSAPLNALSGEIHQVVHSVQRFVLGMTAGGATAGVAFGLGLWLSSAAIAGRPSVLDPSGEQRPWLGRCMFLLAIFPLPELGFLIGYRGTAFLFDRLSPDERD